MWILTQNRERILSTEGMNEIRVSDPASDKTDYAIMLYRKIDGRPFALGFYRRKERAKDILEEIIREQGKFIIQGNASLASSPLLEKTYRQPAVIVPPKTFVMPKDDVE